MHRRARWAAVATAQLALLLVTPAAHSATFTIADGDVNALRSAFAAANVNGEDDVVELAAGGRYVLAAVDNLEGGANGLPAILADSGHVLKVAGGGAVVSRAGSAPDFRLLHVTAGATVELRQVGLTGGRAADGGAILNAGTLSVIDCALSANRAAGLNGGAGAAGGTRGGNGGAGVAASGGAISSTGNLTLVRSTLSANSAQGGAGGAGGAGSSAGGNGGAGGAATGGAIFASAGKLTLTNATFDGNRAIGGRGGDGREAADAGGSGGGGGAAQGGAVASGAATVLQHATIAGNGVVGGGGGRGAAGGTSFGSDGRAGVGWGGGAAVLNGAVVRPRSTILALNTAAGNVPAPDVSGAFRSDGFNIIGNVAGATGFPGPSDQLGADPGLGALRLNGGPVPTRALLGGSPALDAGDPAVTQKTDARGITRPQPAGGRVDVGAYELERAAQGGPTFTVNIAFDVDDGLCGVQNCSLREAIAAANAHPNGTSRDVIRFKLPGGGVRGIVPGSQLPAITDAVLIDGYTQSGAKAATATEPAVLTAGLDGIIAGSADGLVLNGGGSTVRGLVIGRFRHGIVLGGTGGHIVRGNRIGTFPDGSSAIGNDGDGILVTSPGNAIGGAAPADPNLISGNSGPNVSILGAGASGNRVAGNRIGTDVAGRAALGGAVGIRVSGAPDTAIAGNLVSGNAGAGVEVDTGAAGTVVDRNLIGTDAGGTAGVPNGGDGVRILGSATRTLVGSTKSAPRNTIAFNRGAGVRVSSGTDNAILGNAIFSNVRSAVVLGTGTGVPNDAGDGDTGPNRLQNFPVITAAAAEGATTRLRGVLDSGASTSFRIELFAADSATDARRLVTAFKVTTPPAAGPVPFALSLPAASAVPGEILTATATRLDDAGAPLETSGLSGSRRLCSLVVTTAADTGPGSLRDAIACANETPNEGTPDTIRFAIPVSDPGYDAAGKGFFSISPRTALPALTDPVIVDGYTQPGDAATGKPAARPNTLADGDDAIIKIQLLGPPVGFKGAALTVNGADSTVRGLSVVFFNATAIVVGGSRVRITGNFVGLHPDGGPLQDGEGIQITGADATIGGTAPADRNIVSADGNAINLNGSRGKVLGNYIGTTPSGKGAAPNARAGVRATGPQSEVGGATPGAGNLIANSAVGVELRGTIATVLGNRLIENSTGIAVNSASSVRIGGVDPGQGNEIARTRDFGSYDPDGDAIIIEDTKGVTIRGNSIHDNAGLGIDLDNDRVTANDNGDADSGANDRQNFPLLTGVGTEPGRTTILGTLNSGPTRSFLIDLYSSAKCDFSGFGEGETYLGSVTVRIGVNIPVDFRTVLPFAVPDGQVVTATARDGFTVSTSEFSACKAAEPLPVPVAPSDLRAESVSSRAVALRWTDESIFEDGFRIERADVHGKSRKLKFKRIGEVGRGATAFTDDHVKDKKSYVYRVIAFNRAGNSRPSDVLRVATPKKAGKGHS